MNYPDTIKLAHATPDGYGDKTVTSFTTIPATFIKRAGVTRDNHSEGETSDAAVYLRPAEAVAYKDDLEGMFLLAEPFTDKNWYKIAHANVAQRKLLNNAIDNIYCRLEKIAGPPYVVS